MIHVALAFLSGVTVEFLYTIGVLYIGERRSVLSGAISAVWGVAFLVGVNESFRTWVAAGFWCVGLGVGTILGVEMKRRADRRQAERLLRARDLASGRAPHPAAGVNMISLVAFFVACFLGAVGGSWCVSLLLPGVGRSIRRGCVCQEIQRRDPERHFKGCPMRKDLAPEKQATIDAAYERRR